MAKQLKEIEIPFGAKDSELCGWEYTIPEGMEATIVDNKIVVKKKESEDERIRKELLNAFIESTDSLYMVLTPLKREAFIAWLEKQGSEPNWCHHKVDLSDCSEEYRKAYYDGWNNCNQQHAQLEAEQKPAEVRTTGYWHVEDVEQKPWSEEDEQYLEDTLNLLEGHRSKNTYGDVVEWLKELKDRVGCEADCTTTWKPSEEQMEGLKEVIKFLGCTKTRREQLQSLYDDLKKLREE